MGKLFIVFLLLFSLKADSILEPNNIWRIGTLSSIALLYATNPLHATHMQFEVGSTNLSGQNVTVFKTSFMYKAKPLYTWGDLTLTRIMGVDYIRMQNTLNAYANNIQDSIGFFPAYRLEYAFEGFKPFFEAGVGFYLINHLKYLDTQFSTNFQFGDSVFLGVDILDKFQLGYRFFHMSNAELDRPNPAVNMQLFVFGYTY